MAQAVLRLVTGWAVRRSNPVGVEIFRTTPDRPWDPPSLLAKGTGSLSRGKAPQCDADHPLPSGTEVRERVELHIYSPVGPSWPVLE